MLPSPEVRTFLRTSGRMRKSAIGLGSTSVWTRDAKSGEWLVLFDGAGPPGTPWKAKRRLKSIWPKRSRPVRRAKLDLGFAGHERWEPRVTGLRNERV